MSSLYQHALSGDLPGLRTRLARVVSYVCATNVNGGGALDDGERLLVEAEYYARIGDLEEATYRLRLREAPKFASVADCKKQYAAAMVEKRGAAT